VVIAPVTSQEIQSPVHGTQQDVCPVGLFPSLSLSKITLQIKREWESETMRLFILVFLISVIASVPESSHAFRLGYASSARLSESLKKKSSTTTSGRSSPSNAAASAASHEDGLVLPRHWSRFLYIMSAFGPLVAVLWNDYARMPLVPTSTTPSTRALARTYETLFFFARLKPRVSFAIGAVLRGLQMTTALQYVFDPTVGVGFGLQLVCYLVRSRWPSTLILGWSLSPKIWHFLGAAPPSSRPVPISISMKR
jgi:hypothetical protein